MNRALLSFSTILLIAALLNLVTTKNNSFDINSTSISKREIINSPRGAKSLEAATPKYTVSSRLARQGISNQSSALRAQNREPAKSNSDTGQRTFNSQMQSKIQKQILTVSARPVQHPQQLSSQLIEILKSTPKHSLSSADLGLGRGQWQLLENYTAIKKNATSVHDPALSFGNFAIVPSDTKITEADFGKHNLILYDPILSLASILTGEMEIVLEPSARPGEILKDHGLQEVWRNKTGMILKVRPKSAIYLSDFVSQLKADPRISSTQIIILKDILKI